MHVTVELKVQIQTIRFTYASGTTTRADFCLYSDCSSVYFLFTPFKITEFLSDSENGEINGNKICLLYFLTQIRFPIVGEKLL